MKKGKAYKAKKTTSKEPVSYNLTVCIKRKV